MTHKIIITFLRLRREIRRHQELDVRVYWAVRRARRDVVLLKKGTVFEQARAKTIAARASTLDEIWHNGNLHNRELGRKLLAMAPAFDVVTTFEQRLDLLNVNVVDRARIDGGAGLVELVAGYFVEDSAARRGENRTSGALFSALEFELISWMTSTAEGLAATDKALLDTFGAMANSLLGKHPKLQLVGAPSPSTPKGGTT